MFDNQEQRVPVKETFAPASAPVKAAPAPAPAPAKKNSRTLLYVLLAVLAVVVVGIIAFFAYQKFYVNKEKYVPPSEGSDAFAAPAKFSMTQYGFRYY